MLFMITQKVQYIFKPFEMCYWGKLYIKPTVWKAGSVAFDHTSTGSFLQLFGQLPQGNLDATHHPVDDSNLLVLSGKPTWIAEFSVIFVIEDRSATCRGTCKILRGFNIFLNIVKGFFKNFHLYKTYFSNIKQQRLHLNSILKHSIQYNLTIFNCVKVLNNSGGL